MGRRGVPKDADDVFGSCMFQEFELSILVSVRRCSYLYAVRAGRRGWERWTDHMTSKPRDDPRYLSVFKKERDKAQLSFRSPKTRSRGNVLTVMSSFSLQTPEPSWVNANSKLGHNVTTYRTYEYSSLQNSNRLHETTLPRVTRDACFTAGLLRKPQPKQEAGQRSHSVHISNLDCIKVFAIEEEGKQSQLSVNKNVKSFGGNSRDSCGRSRDSESW